jgi:hypothetical protein
MARQMRVGCTSRQIDLGKGSGRPRMMATQLAQASDERRALYHTARWLRCRRQFLMDHPLCEACTAAGLVVAVVVVDHVHGHQHRYWRETFWDERGWQSLCLDHHNAKSAAELAQWNRAGGGHRKDDE